MIMTNTTVLLVDDHTIVRQGLKATLSSEKNITIVGEAQTGREAVDLAGQLEALSGDHGPSDAAAEWSRGDAQILKSVPTAKVIVLSTYGDDEHVQQALAAGAAAYLLKQPAAEDVCGCHPGSQQGQRLFQPRHRQAAQRANLATAGDTRTPDVELTQREAEVLQLIAEGYANKQIAAELNLSVKTVEKHRQQVMQKLNIHNIAGLVRHAAAKGIIEANVAGVPTN